jgi:hypothetical protein
VNNENITSGVIIEFASELYFPEYITLKFVALGRKGMEYWLSPLFQSNEHYYWRIFETFSRNISNSHKY